jgi:hypothetical protein
MFLAKLTNTDCREVYTRLSSRRQIGKPAKSQQDKAHICHHRILAASKKATFFDFAKSSTYKNKMLPSSLELETAWPGSTVILTGHSMPG